MVSEKIKSPNHSTCLDDCIFVPLPHTHTLPSYPLNGRRVFTVAGRVTSEIFPRLVSHTTGFDRRSHFFSLQY